MARKYVDCREVPSENNCTVTICADTEQELMEVAVQHAVSSHGHEDTAQFRKQVQGAIKDGTPRP